MEIEELVAMMLEDLGLPNLEKKDAAEIEISLGFKIRGIKKSGPRVLMDSRRSSRIPFGRFFVYFLRREPSPAAKMIAFISSL